MIFQSRQAILDHPDLSPEIRDALLDTWRRTEIIRQEVECDRLRKLAHEAPLNPYREDHDGYRWVAQFSNAWADRSREWMAACAKLEAMRK